ncbi:MAG: nickel pincer cofactor biosynthesis protein LarC [Lachnospiraceae bacterium]|nr:nickel pincer cofactor biosynthesis protein LarC [Lachnospiraceae bacterium]
MKTLYLDCGMGAAGDMLTAALLELFPDKQDMIDRLNSIGIPDVIYSAVPSVKCGITGTHMSVTVRGAEESAEDYCEEHIHDGSMHSHDDNLHDEHTHDHGHDHSHENHYEHTHDHVHDDRHEHTPDHEHEHSHSHSHSHVHHGLADIEHIIRDHLELPAVVRNNILKVFGLIAEAESHVHNVPITDIHFHEVGTMDAVADVTAVCYLMNELSPDVVIASPVRTGFGQVKCAHGILPVPAPATAFILQGIPAYAGEIRGEMCTPTGAALLKYFVDRFENMPVMRTESVGYGMGTKDFPAANCVRAMFGESLDNNDSVIELSCNVDDMTAESIGYAVDRLFDGGALDVYTVPIGMKKGRPGTLIRVLCKKERLNPIVELIFKHTTTLGIRRCEMGRYILDRKIETVDTPYGPVRRKTSSGYGVKRSKYEYDDLSRIATEQGKSIADIIAECNDHFRK